MSAKTETTTTAAPALEGEALNARIAELALNVARAAEQEKTAKEDGARYKEELIALIGVGKVEAGDFKVAITRSMNMDAAKLEAAFPVSKFPELYVQKLDAAAAKKKIAPEDLPRYQTPGNASVRVS